MTKHPGMLPATLMLVVLIGSLPTLAADDDAPGAQLRIRGEVTAVQHRAGPDGEMQTRIQIRTRTREQHWLHVGPQAQLGDAFQVGDQVRARVRVRTGETLGQGQLLRIRNQDTGATDQTHGNGSMMQTRTGTRCRTDAGGPANGGPRSSRAAMPGGGGRGGR